MLPCCMQGCLARGRRTGIQSRVSATVNAKSKRQNDASLSLYSKGARRPEDVLSDLKIDGYRARGKGCTKLVVLHVRGSKDERQSQLCYAVARSAPQGHSRLAVPVLGMLPNQPSEMIYSCLPSGWAPCHSDPGARNLWSFLPPQLARLIWHVPDQTLSQGVEIVLL